MKAIISTALILALTQAQLPSSSSDGDSHGWGVGEPGPGDRGYRPTRGTVKIRTGMEMTCPRPGDAANAALEARTNFHALYDEMFSRIDHGGSISCMDVVCSVVPLSGNVIVLVDLEIASEVGEDEEGGWYDHADRRLTAGDCWGANAHTAPGDRCYRPSCKVKKDDSGWTTWNDRRLQGSSDSAEGGLTEVCVEAEDDEESGWTEAYDRRRRLDLNPKTPLGGEMETFMWKMIQKGRRLHGHTAVDAEEALAAYEVAAVEMAISGAMGDAFDDAFRGPPADVDKTVGPGDRGYDASLVFGDCTVEPRGTVRLIRQSEASVDEEEKTGGGGGSKKSSSSSDEVVIGVVVAIAFLIILCGVLYCTGCGRGGGSKTRNSSSCASASACASTPAEPVKLGPLEPEPDKGMIRSYEMASTSATPRALEEGKEDVYASSTVRNPIKTPVV